MSVYLLINILIIAVPLMLSFEKKLKYYKQIPAVIISILLTGGIFILWDIAATARGDWAFNQAYISGFKILNLPLEEILFFVTVPYACLFIFETTAFYIPEKILNINDNYFYAAASIFLIGAIYFADQDYTFTVLLFSGIFLIIALNFYKEILKSRNYWTAVGISFLPFLFVNYFLTSLPVVTYNSNAIWGIRFITIPAEDFFYSYSMISYFILSYSAAKNLMLERKNKISPAEL